MLNKQLLFCCPDYDDTTVKNVWHIIRPLGELSAFRNYPAVYHKITVQFLSVESFDKKRQCCYNDQRKI